MTSFYSLYNSTALLFLSLNSSNNMHHYSEQAFLPKLTHLSLIIVLQGDGLAVSCVSVHLDWMFLSLVKEKLPNTSQGFISTAIKLLDDYTDKMLLIWLRLVFL